MSKPRSLSDLVPGLAKNILGRKSVLFGKLLGEWPNIAGAEMASKAMPMELKFAKKPPARSPAKAGAQSLKNTGSLLSQGHRQSQAVLHLAVQSAFALEVSYQKSLLIERLNMFFGYPAIKDIKIIQQTNIMDKNKAATPVNRPLTLQEEQNISEMVGKIQENDLQTALRNLGKAILSHTK
jgi:hypothetical protein